MRMDLNVRVPDAPLIEMRGIVKTYNVGRPNELEILHGIDLTVEKGEFVAIVGESGSGKSTLMNIIGVLDRPTRGSYLLDGLDVASASRDAMSEIRNRKIGFIFQNFNLIGRTTALQNVELPMLYAGVSRRARLGRAQELLTMVGMADRERHQPSELSGGQKQRVAIARSLVNDPAILLADEPTGALDSETSRVVMNIFHDLHERQGKTIVFITHSHELAAECPRIVTLKDGRIVHDTKGDGHADR
jgi:putative ABC transport system ATP-binding protein